MTKVKLPSGAEVLQPQLPEAKKISLKETDLKPNTQITVIIKSAVFTEGTSDGTIEAVEVIAATPIGQ